MIYELLAHGKSNVTSMDYLEKITGKSKRTIQKIINEERKTGAFICSLKNGKGYFIAETIEEKEEFYKTYKSQAISILEMLKQFKKSINEQKEMEEIERFISFLEN